MTVGGLGAVLAEERVASLGSRANRGRARLGQGLGDSEGWLVPEARVFGCRAGASGLQAGKALAGGLLHDPCPPEWHVVAASESGWDVAGGLQEEREREAGWMDLGYGAHLWPPSWTNRRGVGCPPAEGRGEEEAAPGKRAKLCLGARGGLQSLPGPCWRDGAPPPDCARFPRGLPRGQRRGEAGRRPSKQNPLQQPDPAGHQLGPAHLHPAAALAGAAHQRGRCRPAPTASWCTAGARGFAHASGEARSSAAPLPCAGTKESAEVVRPEAPVRCLFPPGSTGSARALPLHCTSARPRHTGPSLEPPANLGSRYQLKCFDFKSENI